jgi:preprotein translocase SecE subunit
MKTPEKKEKTKLSTKIKNTTSELKRVSWPGFGKAVKQTSVVIGVVLVTAVVLFGLDRLLSWLFQLLIG